MQDPRPLPPECPFWSRSVTLVCFQSGKASFCHDLASKKVALNEYGSWALFVAWPGRWTTDLFKLTDADVRRLLIEKTT